MSLDTGEIAGHLIITWPKTTGPHGALAGWRVTLTDADSGQQITSVLDMNLVVHAEPRALVTAELTMLTDRDGRPLSPGAKPVIADDGENIATGRYCWIVTEMRIAE
jgi:hypothetical protein